MGTATATAATTAGRANVSVISGRRDVAIASQATGGDGDVIVTEDLTKTYGSITAVDHLSLKVRQGEVYGFLGPNGAGKTTTLRMLVGLIRPTSGRITIEGREPGAADTLATIGSMIETPSFYPFLSGHDNLAILAKYTGTSPANIDRVLEMVDLSGRAKDRFATYSLGMKQRLGVAAALLKDPDILILDEPTNGLDPAGMADMRDLIRALGTGTRTVLLSSHLMHEVEQVCDRLGVIAGGRMVAEGTVDDLRGRETIVIRTDRPEPAQRQVTGFPGVATVETGTDSVTVHITEGRDVDTAGLNRALVSGGIPVRELRREQPSLESVFLSLTASQDQHDNKEA